MRIGAEHKRPTNFGCEAKASFRRTSIAGRYCGVSGVMFVVCSLPGEAGASRVETAQTHGERNAMTIELTPEHQRIIERVMHTGAYPDAQHVISAALKALAEDMQADAPPRKSRLWELREGLNLGDTSIRELIDEGRE